MNRRTAVATVLTAAGALPVTVAVAIVAPGLWFAVPAAALMVLWLASEYRVRVAMRRELEVILGDRRDV
jgi:uncharacterized membrane protein